MLNRRLIALGFLPGHLQSHPPGDNDFASRLGYCRSGRRLGEFAFEPKPARPHAFGLRRDLRGSPAVRLQHRRRPADEREGGPAASGKSRCGDRVQEHGQGISDPDPRVQGRVRTRGLEAGSHRALRAAEELSDLPLVGRTRPITCRSISAIRTLSTAPTAAPARSSWCTAIARRAAATR